MIREHVNQEYMKIIYEMLINFLLELLFGYIVILILSKLILYPGKNKIQNITNERENLEKRLEIIKVRKWICIGWTVLIVIFNLYLIIK